MVQMMSGVQRLNGHQILWIHLLQETDIIQDGDRIISFAPGEGMPVHYSTFF